MRNRQLKNIRETWACLLLLSAVAQAGAEEPIATVPAEPRPPWQRLLPDAAAKKAGILQAQVKELYDVSDYTAAVAVAKELLALREKFQGKDHWQTVVEQWQVQRLSWMKGATELERADIRRWRKEEQEALAQEATYRYAKAQVLREKILTGMRKLLGEEHPDTATSDNSLAQNLNAQGKYPEAEQSYHKALAIRLKVLGEEHPDTAGSYNNLAANLRDQGKYTEAEQGHRKALFIFRVLD